ncbi:MAG: GspE/PulE family protein [Ilumatobacter sp.]|uniref:GspE/PulE family protein n=1 Tax=Ilumatobacter sp. TaxID=1967498 RepID=UPI002618E5BC|nr:GspE/PulE family protein [Ilumatobacter sp.]MDJ0768645.1 GspE/PulE family protein [Ilumatobacter sp.]
MALRKGKDDKKTPDEGGGAVAVEERPGESVEECVALGQALVEAGHLEGERLAEALGEANGELWPFGQMLLTKYGVGRAEYAQALSKACGLPVADPTSAEVDLELGEHVEEKVARKFFFIPVAESGGKVTVWSADCSTTKRDAAESAAGKKFDWVATDPKTITSYMEQIWRSDADIGRLVAAFEETDAAQQAAEEAINEVSLDDQAPVVQLVSRIVGQALRDRASDIHIEPLDKDVRVRYRIDGQLVEVVRLPLTAHNPLVSRLKIMSSMNIVEKRAPQDGQFSTTVDSRPLDVRVSSVATVFGEKVVMRLLDKSKSMVGLNELGMPRETYNTYSKIVHAPYGMVICAGPTGAGKTTTLYATLLEINSGGKNVTTIEDPVEYVFPGINQVGTNERAGLTFATGLKALLRQDPDVILVGEVRDADTARIAVQSALTGHFVLSSLHGNDSVAAVHRLLDMGIEAFLVASAVVAVVSQRLVRRICDNCKEEYEPTADEIAVFRQHSGGSDKVHFFRGRGCSYCSNTGYHGRIGVYELLKITPELRRLIVGWATTEELRRLAVAQGMRTMLREAMQLVEDDVTTIHEVVKTLFAS